MKGLAIFSGLLMGLAAPVLGGAPELHQGSFVSPDGRFVFVFAPGKPAYFKELATGRLITSVQVQPPNPAPAADAPLPPSTPAVPLQLAKPFYDIAWTGDSQTLLVISEVGSGSIAQVLHFAGGVWHLAYVAPAPAEEKGPWRETQRKRGYTITSVLNASWRETVLDYKVRDHTLWCSFGVEANPLGANSHNYRCNFTFDPATRELSDVEVSDISAPDLAWLKSVRGFVGSPFLKVSLLKRATRSNTRTVIP